MKNFSMIVTLLVFCACTKETRSDIVVNITKVDGKYEVVCDPISEEEFMQNFQPGWYCSSIHDVLSDGSLGEDYTKLSGSVNGSPSWPNIFSVCQDDRIKVYSFFEDFSGDYYNYRYVSYSYNPDGNRLTFNGSYFSITQGIEGRNYNLTDALVILLTESDMDLLAPLWRHDYTSEKAVYTLFRFSKLTREKVDQLNSLYTEGY